MLCLHCIHSAESCRSCVQNLEAVKEDLRKLSASEHGLSQENGRLQEAARHKDNDIKHLRAMLERAQTEAER